MVGQEERDLSMGALGIQRRYSRVDQGRYALQSELVFFLPDHTRQSHKNWSGVGRLPGVKVA